MVDRVLGAVALLIFAAPMCFIAACIISIDGQPLLFVQERLGHRRRLVRCLKFRTMRDGSITKTGYWLRRTGLDELPQLINIVRGEMRAVGPRPVTHSDAERFGYLDPVSRRFEALPGMTGVAQVWGTTSTNEARVLDEWYAANQTLLLDLYLIVLTLVANLVGKARVQRWLRSCDKPLLNVPVPR